MVTPYDNYVLKIKFGNKRMLFVNWGDDDGILLEPQLSPGLLYHKYAKAGKYRIDFTGEVTALYLKSKIDNFHIYYATNEMLNNCNCLVKAGVNDMFFPRDPYYPPDGFL